MIHFQPQPATGPRHHMQKGLTFYPGPHVYMLEDERLFNVTTVMREHKISADWSAVPPEVLAQKRDLGLAVHIAAHYYDEGDLKADTIDDRVQPYLAAWQTFTEENQFEPLLLETPLAHPVLKYAGTVDRFGVVHRLQDPALPFLVPAIVDIKTGDPDDAGAAVQTAAYEQLIRAEFNPQHFDLSIEGWERAWTRYSVQLLPTGRYKLCTYRNPRDLHRFNWALSLEASAHPSWRRRS